MKSAMSTSTFLSRARKKPVKKGNFCGFMLVSNEEPDLLSGLGNREPIIIFPRRLNGRFRSSFCWRNTGKFISGKFGHTHHSNFRLYKGHNNMHEKNYSILIGWEMSAVLLARVQTCNTSAKLVTPVQITNGSWLAENTKETINNQSD